MKRRVAGTIAVGVAATIVLGGVGAAFAVPDVMRSATPGPQPAETVAPPRTDGAVPTAAPSIAGISQGEPPTDSEAEAFLRADTADFLQLNAVFVRHATIGELQSLVGDDGLPAGYSSGLQVLLVTGVGSFRPSYTKTGATFGWGTMVISAADGGLIGTSAQPGELPELLRATG